MRLHALLLAGLVAGLLFNLAGLILVYTVLGPPYMKAFLAHLPEPPTAAMVARHLGIRLGFGVLAVFLFAVLRPGVGPGPRAVVTAAAVIFLSAHVPLALALSEFGILIGWRFWVTLAWGAGEAVGATASGAVVYRWLAARPLSLNS